MSASAIRRAVAARARLLCVRGIRRLRAGRPDEAIPLLEAARDRGLDTTRLHRSLAEAYVAAERWKKVRRLARQGLDRAPRDPRLRLALGRAEEARGALAAAAVHYTAAVVLDPGLEEPAVRAAIDRVERTRSMFEPVIYNDQEDLDAIARTLSRGGEAFDRNFEHLTSQYATISGAYRRSLWATMRASRRRYLRSGDEREQRRIASLVEAAEVGDPSELMMRFASRHDLALPSSFLASIALRSRRRQLLKDRGQDLPEWILNTKRRAYEFGDLLDVDRPWRSLHPLPLDEIEPAGGTVLKPSGGGGSRGVLLYRSMQEILEISTGTVFSDPQAARARAAELLQSGEVPSDSWYLETLIEDADGSPARDLKFYSFYGTVALVLEIDRFPKPRYCWWHRDGRRADIPLYRERGFEGVGASEEDVALAERISREIPAPFVRIDFLAGGDQTLLGEFTARPGDIERFDPDLDRWLGADFLEAESRLEEDLVRGAAFTAFSRLRELRFHNPHVPGSGRVRSPDAAV